MTTEGISNLENAVNRIEQSLQRIEAQQDTRLGRIEVRLDNVEARLDRLEVREDTHFRWLIGILVTSIAVNITMWATAVAVVVASL